MRSRSALKYMGIVIILEFYVLFPLYKKKLNLLMLRKCSFLYLSGQNAPKAARLLNISDEIHGARIN